MWFNLNIYIYIYVYLQPPMMMMMEGFDVETTSHLQGEVRADPSGRSRCRTSTALASPLSDAQKKKKKRRAGSKRHRYKHTYALPCSQWASLWTTLSLSPFCALFIDRHISRSLDILFYPLREREEAIHLRILFDSARADFISISLWSSKKHHF